MNDDKECVQIAETAARALWSVSQSRKNIQVMMHSGAEPLLARLLRLGAITPLVGYMAEGNAEVHRTTALALYYLSKNPFNCITMHESGVVPFLLKTVASTDEKLQDASAGCLGNIRRLALEAETYHLITRGEKKEESSDDED